MVNFKILGSFAVSTLVMGFGALSAQQSANAALLGDTINARAEFTFSPFDAAPCNVLDNPGVVVGPGVELPQGLAQGACVGGAELDIDGVANTITLTGYFPPGGYDLAEFWLEDLDWVDTPGIITGVSLVSDLDQAFNQTTPTLDLSFTDDSIHISFVGAGGFFAFAPDAQTVFEFTAEHDSVPEPLTLAGTFVALGLGSVMKKKLHK